MSKHEGHYKRTTIFEVLDSRGTRDVWLAQQVGCSTSLISKLRHGQRRIPRWFAVRAATAVALPEEVLFFDLVLPNGSEPDPSEREPANV